MPPPCPALSAEMCPLAKSVRLWSGDQYDCDLLFEVMTSWGRGDGKVMVHCHACFGVK